MKDKNEQSSKQLLETIEQWTPIITRMLLFIFGILIVTFDALLMEDTEVTVRLAFLFAGISMLGPVVAASFAEIVKAARGKTN